MMGSKSPDTVTQVNQPPEYLSGFMDYINNTVQPMIGTGQLNPRLPEGFQYNAPLAQGVTNANNSIQSYLQGPQYQNAQNQMFGGLSNLYGGNVPGNPLSSSGGFNQNTMEQTLLGLMTGSIPGMNGQGQGSTGPGFIMGPRTDGGNIGFTGGGWSSGPAGGYNPMTNSDIQRQIDATADDLTEALKRGGLRDIRMESVADGGLGGSRQGIREGVAEEGLGRAILSESARIRNEADNNERNRLAQLAATNVSAGASAGASGLASQTQLAIAQMGNQLDWGRLLSGNALGAANANQGLMNSGYGFGLDAIRGALGMAPGIMQSPIQNQIPGAQLGFDITNYLQGNADRDVNNYLRNNSTFLNDLGTYSNLIFGSNPSAYASQQTQTPGASRLGSALGGAMSGYSMSGGQGWGSALGFWAGLLG